MKKLHIAFCLRDMKIGGVESVLIRTIDELLKNPDIKISMISYVDISEPVYRDYFKSHPEIKMYSLYPSKFFGTKLSHFFLFRIVQHFVRDVYRFIRRMTFNVRKFSDIDVLIDYYNFSFWREFKRFRQPKVIWWHASINTFVSGKYIRYMGGYDKMVALTDGFVDEFKSLYPEYKNKIVRIYNPVNIADIQRRAKTGNSVDVKGKYFSVVSRLYPDKDIPTVIYAFDSFWNQNDNPDVKLVVVGDGSYRERFRKIADGVSAGKQIMFVGAIPNPMKIMQKSVAHILSSHSEGLPTVCIEAQAVKTLSIASDCKNGPRDILMNGRAGLLFTPGDVSGLAQCMSDAFNKNHDKMIQCATDALTRFDSGLVSKQIIKLLKAM